MIGCHDNGYVNTIRSHITSGFKEKFILLKSYAEHAGGFGDLELPVHSIPGLFIAQKFAAPFPSQDSFTPSGSPFYPSGDATVLDALSPGTIPIDIRQLASEPGHQGRSYSSPMLHSKPLKATEQRLTFGSETASDYGNASESGYSNSQVGAIRRLDPNLVCDSLSRFWQPLN